MDRIKLFRSRCLLKQDWWRYWRNLFISGFMLLKSVWQQPAVTSLHMKYFNFNTFLATSTRHDGAAVLFDRSHDQTNLAVLYETISHLSKSYINQEAQLSSTFPLTPIGAGPSYTKINIGSNYKRVISLATSVFRSVIIVPSAWKQSTRRLSQASSTAAEVYCIESWGSFDGPPPQSRHTW